MVRYYGFPEKTERGKTVEEKILKSRQRKLQELLELNYIYPVQDHRLIHFLTLLDQHWNEDKELQNEAYQQYRQLKNMMNHYGFVNNQMITEHDLLKSRYAKENNIKLSKLERRFQTEMHISIDEFITNYLTRSNDQYERWGLTTVKLDDKTMEKYHITDHSEVRDTYRFQKDGEDWVEVCDPHIMQLIAYLEDKKMQKQALDDYHKMESICNQYHIQITPQFDIIDFLSCYVGFYDRNELNAYFIAETDLSVDEFIKQYVDKGQLDHVSVWGMVQTKENQTVDTYKFIPTGNQTNITNTKTPLVDFVNEMRNQTEEIKPHITTIQDLEITSYPEYIIKHFANIPTFERHVNELLELQSYGLSFDEIKLYIYQKFLAHNALLLKTSNYLELAQRDVWALIFIHQFQSRYLYQSEEMAEAEEKFIKSDEKQKKHTFSIAKMI